MAPAASACLRISILGARGLDRLPNVEVSRTLDPFCICSVIKRMQICCKTPVVENSRDPLWFYTSRITEVPLDDSLLFAVFNRVASPSGFLCSSALECSAIFPNGFDGDLELKDQGGNTCAMLRIVLEPAQQVQATSKKLKPRRAASCGRIGPSEHDTAAQRKHDLPGKTFRREESAIAQPRHKANRSGNEDIHARLLAPKRDMALVEKLLAETEAKKHGQRCMSKEVQARLYNNAPKMDLAKLDSLRADAEQTENRRKKVSNPEIFQRLMAPKVDYAGLVGFAEDLVEEKARQLARPPDLERISELARPKWVLDVFNGTSSSPDSANHQHLLTADDYESDGCCLPELAPHGASSVRTLSNFRRHVEKGVSKEEQARIMGILHEMEEIYRSTDAGLEGVYDRKYPAADDYDVYDGQLHSNMNPIATSSMRAPTNGLRYPTVDLESVSEADVASSMGARASDYRYPAEYGYEAYDVQWCPRVHPIVSSSLPAIANSHCMLAADVSETNDRRLSPREECRSASSDLRSESDHRYPTAYGYEAYDAHWCPRVHPIVASSLPAIADSHSLLAADDCETNDSVNRLSSRDECRSAASDARQDDITFAPDRILPLTADSRAELTQRAYSERFGVQALRWSQMR